jgi:hypothetical protein
MPVPVAADLMPGFRDPPHQGRMALRYLAEKEKGAPRIVLREQIQNVPRVRFDAMLRVVAYRQLPVVVPVFDVDAERVPRAVVSLSIRHARRMIVGRRSGRKLRVMNRTCRPLSAFRHQPERTLNRLGLPSAIPKLTEP